MTRDKKHYDANKEQIKEEGLKKRTMNKVKALVSKGAVKEEELKEILPKQKEEVKQIPINKVVDEIVKEVPFEKPLPKKRVPKPKPVEQPAEIPFEKPLPKPKGMGWKYPAEPIDIPQKKEKDRFMKLIYYKEPSKKSLKKLEKLQESSSSSDESSEDEAPVKHQQVNDEDAYYRALAKRLYG